MKFGQQWHCHAYYWFSRDRCKHDVVYSFRLLLYKQLVSPSETYSLFLPDSFCWIYGGKHPTTAWLDSFFQIGTIYWFHDGTVFGHQIIIKCTYVSEFSTALLCTFLAEVWAKFFKKFKLLNKWLWDRTSALLLMELSISVAYCVFFSEQKIIEECFALNLSCFL